jgi:hypothetical protein
VLPNTAAYLTACHTLLWRTAKVAAMRDIAKGLLFGLAIGVPWLIVQLLLGG